jgi:hypothetical protein
LSRSSSLERRPAAAMSVVIFFAVSVRVQRVSVRGLGFGGSSVVVVGLGCDETRKRKRKRGIPATRVENRKN